MAARAQQTDAQTVQSPPAAAAPVESAPETRVAKTDAAPTVTETLEAKMKILEERIKQLEAQQAASNAAAASAAAAMQQASQGGGQRQGQLPPGVAAVQMPPGATGISPGAQPPPQQQQVTPESVAAAVAAAPDAQAAQAKAAADAADERSLQASFLFRENAPTLKQNKWEVSVDGSYTRNVSSGFQNERSALAVGSLRYGIAEGVEVGLTIPWYYTTRSTLASLDQFTIDEVKSFGDVTAQVSTQLWAPKDWYPGAAFTGTVTIPTGESPYTFGINYDQGQDPRDPFSNVQSRDQWGTGASVVLFRTFDPVILFMRFGLDYTFEKQIDGHTVDDSLRYRYDFGMSLALSEFTTVGVQLTGSMENSLSIDGVHVFGGPSESLATRLTLIQRLDEDFYMEPSITMGLTDETPDVGLGLGVRKRF